MAASNDPARDPTGLKRGVFDVPAAWGPIVEILRQFREATRAIAGASDPAAVEDARGRLESAHAALVEHARALVEPPTLVDLAARDRDRILLRGALHFLRLERAIHGDLGVLDTGGSRLLHLYRADFSFTSDREKRFEARLREVLDLSDEDFAAVADRVERDFEDARLKQVVVRAIRDEFGLRTDAADLRERSRALFELFFPGAPLVAGEVDVIVTGTLLFFCIPFESGKLRTERFDTLTADERQRVQDFLARLSDYGVDVMARFPAFARIPGALDPTVLERLVVRSGLDAATVESELRSLVTVLPTAEIDKYVVHDVWGHAWQASLLELEHVYRELATYEEPLSLGLEARLDGGESLTLRQCFTGEGEALELDEERFVTFVRATVAHRVPAALTASAAELVADVAEFKVAGAHPDAAAFLKSSSQLPEFPSKLDLSLGDLDAYLGLATRAFSAWASSPEQRAATAYELVSDGASPAAAGTSLDRACKLWRELETGAYSHELALVPSPESDGAILVNLFTRLALNLVAIHGALIESSGTLAEAGTGDLPVAGLQDLLLIGALAFFEDSPADNLWRIDEFITECLVPFACRLTRP